MDTDQLVTFLATLEPAFETHEFLWCGLHPDGRRVQAYGTLENMLPRLLERNNQGFGIFVAVNAIDTPTYEGGFARRRSEDITRIRAVFADWDTPNQRIPQLPFQPTMTVSTSEGKFHFYWCTDDCPVNEFESLQRAIAGSLGSDPSVIDPCRILRAPGFKHTRGHDVCLVQSGGPRYSFAQLKEGFPSQAKKPKFSTWDGNAERKAMQTAAVIAANYLPRPDGGFNIRCPWASEHTKPDTVSCSTYWPPSERNDGRGSYVCMHSHCAHRMVDELDKWISDHVRNVLG